MWCAEPLSRTYVLGFEVVGVAVGSAASVGGVRIAGRESGKDAEEAAGVATSTEDCVRATSCDTCSVCLVCVCFGMFTSAFVRGKCERSDVRCIGILEVVVVVMRGCDAGDGVRLSGLLWSVREKRRAR